MSDSKVDFVASRGYSSLRCAVIFKMSDENKPQEQISCKWDSFKMRLGGFPGGAVVKNPPANAGDMGSSPGPGRSHMLRSN